MKLATLVLAAFLALVPAALVPAARAGAWRPPLDGPVLRGFVVSSDRFAAGQHRGVDLGAPPGAVVRATCGGRVRFAGRVPGGGLTVSVGCGRLIATFQHLRAVAVRRGQTLPAGARLGEVGRSGRPREPRPHLHLGARDAASGRYVDPLGLLGKAPPAAPPVVSGPRRPAPLGPAPPAARPRPAPRPAPLAPAPSPVTASGARRAPPGAPLVVWIGLLSFGLGLPMGGLVRRRRRRRSRAAAAVAARGGRPCAGSLLGG